MPDSELPGPSVSVDPGVLLAVERTMLAWIRTGIAMIGFGFVVARFGIFLRSLAPTGVPTHGLSFLFGAALTAAGAITTGYAALLYGGRLRALERGEALRPQDATMAAKLGIAVAIVGTALAVYLLFT